MPPWFQKLMNECESIALDNPTDQERLWMALKASWPHREIESIIADNYHQEINEDVEQHIARIKAEVIATLEES